MKKKITHIAANIFRVTILLGMVVSFVLVVAFTLGNYNQIVCSDVSVEIDYASGLFFIDEEEVHSMITQNNTAPLVGVPLSEVDLGQIEKQLENSPFVKNADIFSSLDGRVKINIEQLEPLYRIINNAGVNYYISKTGTKMPLSGKFTPRVMVAVGNIPTAIRVYDDGINAKVYEIVQYITNDLFWNALIGQVHVTLDEEIVLIPRMGGQKILLGDAANIENQLTRLKIFYEEGFLHADWQQYETINLKYSNQIVCAKRE